MSDQLPLKDWRHQYIKLESVLKAKNCLEDEKLRVLVLEHCGADLKRPQATYDHKTYTCISQAIASYIYPDKTRADASYQLGYESFDGYRQTIIGRVASAILKLNFISPERILKAALKSLNEADTNAVRQLVQRGPTAYTFEYRNDPFYPYTQLGLLQALVDYIKLSQGRVELVEYSLYNFDINITWREKESSPPRSE